MNFAPYELQAAHARLNDLRKQAAKARLVVPRSPSARPDLRQYREAAPRKASTKDSIVKNH